MCHSFEKICVCRSEFSHLLKLLTAGHCVIFEVKVLIVYFVNTSVPYLANLSMNSKSIIIIQNAYPLKVTTL